MPVGLLSLPDELLVQISTLVLVSPIARLARISQPRIRFTYEDPPSQPTPLSISKPSSQSPQKSPRKRPTASISHYPPSIVTRSRTLAAFPERHYDPYKTRTTISYLFVCQYLRNLATPIFYGNYAWHVGIHDRAPTICTFRCFLDAIGPNARSHIRSIIVFTRFGYSCLLECLPIGWITELRRCEGLRVVYVSTTLRWAGKMLSRKDGWREKLADIWRRKGLEGVEKVEPWNFGLPHDDRLLVGNFYPSDDVDIFLDKILGLDTMTTNQEVR